MQTKYEKIMDRVRVTDEMRSRILHTLETAEADMAAQPDSKVTSLSRWKQLHKSVAVAACVVLVLFGGFGIWYLISVGKNPVAEQGVNGMEEVASIETLEKYVGFSVEEIHVLPFETENTYYMSYGGDMAEITYTGADDEAVFRKAEGTDDVSGDYNVYAEETSVVMGAYTVRLKGESGRYTLGTWTDGTYSYSLQLSNGQTQDVWQAMIESMK